MAGTTKSYDATKILLGPGDLYLNVAVPSAGSRMTVDTTSSVHTPDATANPSAVHLGMTKGGTIVTYKPTVQDFESDEQTAPYSSRIISEEFTIEGEMLQGLNTTLLDKLTVGGTLATGSGYEEIAIGGLSAVATYSVALIVPDITTPGTYFTVVQIYKAYNADGWKFGVTRKEPGSFAFKYSGLAVTTRTAGDQIGKVWKKVA
ncbi:MAG: hypothetical protein ACO24O_06700 [Arenimonas sp.]